MGFDEATLKRFWSKVDKRGPDECWPWTASVNTKGYGYFSALGNHIYAHRFSAVLHIGKQPTPKHMVMHSCDNPACVNPSHMSWATNFENVQDSIAKGRFSYPPKIPYDKRLILIERVKNGESINLLAREYGVVPKTVRNLCKTLATLKAHPQYCQPIESHDNA